MCTGYASVDYNRKPSYASPIAIVIQTQALSEKEIEHLDALNLSDATRAVYANRELTCVDRKDQTGGDLLDFDNDTWLVIAVLEGWSSTAGWCKVAVAKQL